MQTTTQRKINPYRFTSDMEHELLEDETFQNVKDMCLVFINVGEEQFKSVYDKEEALVAYEFCLKKIDDLANIKNVFEIKMNDTPFTYIGHAMDMITVSDRLENLNTSTFYFELGTQINLTTELLMFCLTTIERMLLAYEGDTHDDND